MGKSWKASPRATLNGWPKIAKEGKMDKMDSLTPCQNLDHGDECVKYDKHKLRYDLIPGDALSALAAVYTFGSIKYDDNNWRKGTRWGRVFAALMRHAWAYWRGEIFDPESGLPHMAHVAWCCFTLINFTNTCPQYDDRIKDCIDYSKFLSSTEK
jgi:hypothetical protein